ncbi:MAG: enhanced serine sensitivity protein SseB C-terminal domain-containing protein [Clostridiales bacterium]|nr:enhanced serine sensitivity protein SseB C-terminal domain-containing protein [Clostridiales bacterium]
MGLFDRKNKAEENPEEEKKPQFEKVEFPILTVVVEDVLSMTSTEVSVIGNVRGGTLHEGDKLFLLGRRGKTKQTSALRLEDTLMTKMPEAAEGTNVSIVLEGLRAGEVEKYDVLSSVNCQGAEESKPDTMVNPFLKGMLREFQRFVEDRDYMGRIMEYIANDAILITPCMHAPINAEGQAPKIGFAMIKGKDNQMYLAAFTDTYELELANVPEKIIQAVDFEKAKTIVDKSNAGGLLINPASDKFLLRTQLLAGLEDHKEKIKNHIREQKLDTSKPLMMAIPKEGHEPQELFDALKEYFKTETRVLRAWYGMMVFPQEDKKAHLIIVDTLEEKPEIFGGIGNAAKDHLGDMQLNMQALQKVGNKAVEKMLLFYERTDAIESIK